MPTGVDYAGDDDSDIDEWKRKCDLINQTDNVAAAVAVSSNRFCTCGFLVNALIFFLCTARCDMWKFVIHNELTHHNIAMYRQSFVVILVLFMNIFVKSESGRSAAN